MPKRGRGRPPTIAANGLKRVEILLDPESKRRLMAEAEMDGVPLYTVLQRVLDEEWEAQPDELREAVELYIAATRGELLTEGEPG